MTDAPPPGYEAVVADPADYPPGVVAVPAQGWMWTASVMALFQVRSAMPPGSTMLFGTATSDVCAQRNNLVRWFMEHPESGEWLLFLDSDMTPPPHTVLALLHHRVDVVGGLCFLRQPPYRAVFWTMPNQGTEFTAEQVTGLHEVAGVGTACILVRRYVLDALAEPWFRFETPGINEDHYFCDQVRRAGFRIFLDCDVSVGHIGTTPVDRDWALMWSHTDAAAARRQMREPEAVVVAGQIRRTGRTLPGAAAPGCVQNIGPWRVPEGPGRL